MVHEPTAARARCWRGGQRLGQTAAATIACCATPYGAIAAAGSAVTPATPANYLPATALSAAVATATATAATVAVCVASAGACCTAACDAKVHLLPSQRSARVDQEREPFQHVLPRLWR